MEHHGDRPGHGAATLRAGSARGKLLCCFVPSLVLVMVAAAAVPACFALSTSNNLLLAPGRLFANVNLLQNLLLTT